MTDQSASTVSLWLVAFGVAYGLLHHQGFVLGRLGEFGDSGTRWADWLDVATPYLILIPAAGVLATAGASRRVWLLFVVGAITYVEGHGIHLGANSINNVIADVPTEPEIDNVVELWDERVGHYLWYSGFTIVTVAVASAVEFSALESSAACFKSSFLRQRRAIVGVALTTLAAITYTTNSLEGHFAVPGLLASSVIGILAAWRLRAQRADRQASVENEVSTGLGSLLAALTFIPAFLLLGFYGTWHRGFPDPTSVGWNVLAP